MTIVLCGSGSGGHITPLLAVAKAIKDTNPNTELVFVGEKHSKYSSLTQNSELFDRTYQLYTGKIRRYHGQSTIVSLLDYKTNLLNLRDFFRIIIGVVQGIFLFKKLNADVVFLKGGSICVPAGLGAHLAKIPSITHDSDALPGLSNRIGGRYAKIHATGMPVEYYNYPKDSMIYVGVPVDPRFRVYSSQELKTIRSNYDLPLESKVLLITGGSGGATRLNKWCEEIIPKLLNENKNLVVFFVTGKGKAVKDLGDRVKVIDFTTEMYLLSAVSDVVICRAGTTTLAEFAYQSKAVIVVPNPELTGGHQIKNAKVYHNSDSIVVLDEKDLRNNPDELYVAVSELLNDDQRRYQLGKNLNKTTPKVPASTNIAELLVQINKK